MRRKGPHRWSFFASEAGGNEEEGSEHRWSLFVSEAESNEEEGCAPLELFVFGSRRK